MSKTNVATYPEEVLQPSAQNGQTYTAMRVEEKEFSKNEGKGNASVVGCNSNNDNASVRTLNANNHAGNGNNNYAGAFADILQSNPASCQAMTNTTESREVTDVHGWRDYESLPFWGNAESDTSATQEDDIFARLKSANNKRKLKGLKQFFTNGELISAAFDRAMNRTHTAKRRRTWYLDHKEQICARIKRELEEQTYHPKQPWHRVIVKKGKGDKDRNAVIFDMYDRIIHNLILIIIGDKFRNKFIRNIYSGIKGRSITSNDKRYCMLNKIRHWVQYHQDAWVGQTDVRHFYENLDVKITLGIMFKTIVCPFTRWLLLTAFSNVDRLPIGGTLSQMMAMLVLLECDKEILDRFNVFYCAFGDNRLIGGGKEEVRKAMSWQMSYYEAALGLQVKDDYQIRKVRDGFTFCKYRYYKSFVSVRAEIRRRAVRGYLKGQQHYAGYKGMLMKTDSHRLMNLIENDIMNLTNKHGMACRTQRGDAVKLKDLEDGTQIVPYEFEFELSKAKMKDKGIDEEEAKKNVNAYSFVRLTYIAIKPDGEKRLCHSNEGSEEIVEFFCLVEEGKAELHQKLTVKHHGTKSYFEEYHTTKQEACDLICKELGI